MTPYRKRLCPLTQRLAEDMKIRNLAPATIDAYTYQARRFADFMEKPLDDATLEDVRSFQLHLIESRKLAYSSFHQAVCALRFLYKLKLAGKFAHLKEATAWEAFCNKLASVDWVSFIQPPPTQTSSAEQIVRYLTRYLTGGPISDRRILAADRKQVTFLAREGKRTGGERTQIPVTLPCSQFVRLWCLHIQPDQLTKTRYFGGWCNQRRATYFRQCRQLLETLAIDPVADSDASSTDDRLRGKTDDAPPEDAPLRCSSCQAPALQLIRETAKPSWSAVLDHLDPRCPSWYAETGREEQRHYLLDEYGVDYEDWYLETRVESAMHPPAQPTPLQLYLPGMFPIRDFQLESF